MPRKAFLADLAALATDSGVTSITGIQKDGDGFSFELAIPDGQFTVTCLILPGKTQNLYIDVLTFNYCDRCQ
jgi:hypothetical protein